MQSDKVQAKRIDVNGHGAVSRHDVEHAAPLCITDEISEGDHAFVDCRIDNVPEFDGKGRIAQWKDLES